VESLQRFINRDRQRRKGGITELVANIVKKITLLIFFKRTLEPV
jgi:hypothetical protein